jgi:hypothetical protein
LYQVKAVFSVRQSMTDQYRFGEAEASRTCARDCSVTFPDDRDAAAASLNRRTFLRDRREQGQYELFPFESAIG